jgi:hypothetical protein
MQPTPDLCNGIASFCLPGRATFDWVDLARRVERFVARHPNGDTAH